MNEGDGCEGRDVKDMVTLLGKRMDKMDARYKTLQKTLRTVYNRYYASCIRRDKHAKWEKLGLDRVKKYSKFMYSLGQLFRRLQKEGRTPILLNRKQHVKLRAWLSASEKRDKRWVMPRP